MTKGKADKLTAAQERALLDRKADLFDTILEAPGNVLGALRRRGLARGKKPAIVTPLGLEVADQIDAPKGSEQ